MADATRTVANHDIVGIDARINRFMVEVAKAGSADLSEVSSFDFERTTTYLEALVTYLDYVQGQPELDLPETTPRKYILDVAAPVPDVENESVNDLLRLFSLMRDELAVSQSARRGSRLVSFDESRIRAIIAKAQAFMTGYVATATPLDLPESSPKETQTGAGLDGSGVE